MTLTALAGKIPFKVNGQVAIPKWMQTALADALDKAKAPPESLRFQCRIATDAQNNFASVKLSDGETLSLHPLSHPQFGKNHSGEAFLTAAMTYSGDGQTYTFRWLGDGVPVAMQQIAVKHDMGKAVKATTVDLDLGAAHITPSYRANGHAGAPGTRDHKSEAARRLELASAGVVRKSRSKRNCARLTIADVESNAA